MKKEIYAVLGILCVLLIVFVACYITARGNVSALNDEVRTLNGVVEDANARISALSQETAEKGTEIESLTADVADRDA